MINSIFYHTTFRDDTRIKMNFFSPILRWPASVLCFEKDRIYTLEYNYNTLHEIQTGKFAFCS